MKEPPFVKVVDLALAQRICKEHDNKHEISVDGKKYPLRITLEDGAVEVRLTDLSDVSDQNIIEFLARYGDVITVREQRCGAGTDFPGISTGVRIVKMTVKRNIESWVTIDGEVTNVSYYGQLQTCRHCREYIHIGATCAQNKKLLVQKSYADAAKQMPSQKTFEGDRTNTNQTAADANHTTPTPKNTKSALFVANSAKSDRMPPPKQIPHRQQKLVVPPAMTEQNFPALASASTTFQPSVSGLLTPSTGQQPLASSGVFRKTASGNSDGNDTDSSISSNNDRKHYRTRASSKKPRVEDDYVDNDDGMKSS